jgi:hypothetical protein
MKHITCSLTNQFTSAGLKDIQKHPSEYIPQNLATKQHKLVLSKGNRGQNSEQLFGTENVAALWF